MSDPPVRVLAASLAHETNTFSIKRITEADWAGRLLLRGPEIERLRGTNTESAAHMDAADRYGWTLTQPIATGATPSGPSTAETWATLSDAILLAADAGAVDGILLALHGAMVTEDRDDAEGDLLERLRARFGHDLPIVVTLDLHANVTDAMVAHANAIIPYRTYPHVDQYDIATEAADLLQRLMAGQARSRCVVARGPILDGLDHGRTTNGGIMPELLDRTQAMVRETPGLHAIGLCAGFAWSDIAEAGPSVCVSGDTDPALMQGIATTLMDEIVQRRAETTVQRLTVAEAIARARAPAVGPGPLVIADRTDNPGSGAYGDGVQMLRAMVEAGLESAALGCLYDPDSVQACLSAGAGASVRLALGSKTDPGLYGPPLETDAVVEFAAPEVTFTNDGPMWRGVTMSLKAAAVVRIGGVRVILASNNLQVTDRQVFLACGIDPARCATVVVKSAQHFRSGFQPIAREIQVVDTGCLASEDFSRYTYHKLRRPIWPLDPIPEGAGVG